MEVKWINKDDSFLIDGKKYTRKEANDLYEALDVHFKPIFIPSCWGSDQTTQVSGSIEYATSYTTGGSPPKTF